jgi:hypothetical protein
MRLLSCLVLIGCLMIGAALPARAVDFAPIAGFRFGGELRDTSDSAASRSLTIDSTASYGAVVDLPLPGDFGPRAIELYFSRQQTMLRGGGLLAPPVADLNVNVLHLGLVETVAANDPRLSWLLIGTAGATRFETGAGHDTRPSIGLGGAVRWMANDHVGLRGDLRALINFTGGGGTALACNGGCTLLYAGTVVVQGEASIGIILRF